MGRFEDLSGKTFGNWTVLYRTENKGMYTAWLCRCKCGKLGKVTSQSLKAGTSKSCGCARGQSISDAKIGIKNPKRENKDAGLNAVYGAYKIRDKRCGRSFQLSKEEFLDLTQQNCFYCGDAPSKKKTTCYTGRVFVYNGIDRLDSSKGHIQDNVVPCCTMCNLMKRHFSQQDFLEKIHKIYKHRIEFA